MTSYEESLAAFVHEVDVAQLKKQGTSPIHIKILAGDPSPPNATSGSPTDLSRSLEELKNYQSQMSGWSTGKQDEDGTPSPAKPTSRPTGLPIRGGGGNDGGGLVFRKEPIHRKNPSSASGGASPDVATSSPVSSVEESMSTTPPSLSTSSSSLATTHDASFNGIKLSDQSSSSDSNSSKDHRTTSVGSTPSFSKDDSVNDGTAKSPDNRESINGALKEGHPGAAAGGAAAAAGGGSGRSGASGNPAGKRDERGTIHQKGQQSGGNNKKGEAIGGRRQRTRSRKSSQNKPSRRKQFDSPKTKKAVSKQSLVEKKEMAKAVPLFSHLPQFQRPTSSSLKTGFGTTELIHPVIVRLGLKYASGALTGSNARCVAMLLAFKHFISDYVLPSNESLRRHLVTQLNRQINYLSDCRPKSVSMGNAIAFVKNEISNLTNDSMSEADEKAHLITVIDKFIEERIQLADITIANAACTKISNGDVILTFAASSSVELALKEAKDAGKDFQVVCCDAGPKHEGLPMMRRLVSHGIMCTYVLINAVSYVMKSVSKVMLGAYALLGNGYVMARSGTAVVAAMAHAHHLPVMVCCETYKFTRRVQIDSICHNELGDPRELAHQTTIMGTSLPDISDWEKVENLRLLNLVYDVTPIDFVSVIISEVGMIPPTSVPVILRYESAT